MSLVEVACLFTGVWRQFPLHPSVLPPRNQSWIRMTGQAKLLDVRPTFSSDRGSNTLQSCTFSCGFTIISGPRFSLKMYSCFIYYPLHVLSLMYLFFFPWPSQFILHSLEYLTIETFSKYSKITIGWDVLFVWILIILMFKLWFHSDSLNKLRMYHSGCDGFYLLSHV